MSASSRDASRCSSRAESDLYGRNVDTLCFNNPGHRNFLTGSVEDYTRSYEIDGLMWGSDRQGTLGNALGAKHGGACTECASRKLRNASSERQPMRLRHPGKRPRGKLCGTCTIARARCW